MVGPLDSAYLKYERAAEHLEALDEEVRAFAHREIERLRSERDPQVTQEPQAVWIRSPLGSADPVQAIMGQSTQVVRQLPSRFGVILGDYLVNLRAALDHAVNGIAGTKAGPYTKFPIVAKSEKWRDNAKSDLVGVPVPCRALIRKMQPWHGHRRGKRLLLLATLCNFDKHKLLYSTSLLIYQGIWTFGSGNGHASRMFLDQGVLGDKTKTRITFRGPHEAPKVEGGAPYSIIFTNGPGRQPVVMRLDLTVMLDEVRGIIGEVGDKAKESA